MLALGLAVAAVALGAPQAADKAAAKPTAQGPQPPLVRRDLLTKEKDDSGAPLRDIFRPKTAAVPAPAAVFRPVARKPAAPPAPAGPVFSLNLTFNGSVELAGKVMGLVTVGGQTISVAVGDEITPGYRVVRVASDSIEVEGPNAIRKTFYRQGTLP